MLWAGSRVGAGRAYYDPEVAIARSDTPRAVWRLPGALTTSVVEAPAATWGLAGRSATVEAGAPSFDFPLHKREEVWADEAGRLYAQAAAAQWDPATAIPWDAAIEDPSLRERLRVAVHRRHDALAHTAGLNEEVFDALILLAAGSWQADDLRRGWQRVQTLEREMDEGRRKRLRRLGFDDDDAGELSALHTRNFM